MITNKMKVKRLEGQNSKIKEALYAVIKEELSKRGGGRFEIKGELWDGTEISYIRLNAEGAVVVNGVVADITYLWSVASVEDLLWIAGEMVY